MHENDKKLCTVQFKSIHTGVVSKYIKQFVSVPDSSAVLCLDWAGETSVNSETPRGIPEDR